MPALLVAADTNTTDTMTSGDNTWIRDTTAGSAEPTTARARRHPLAVVVGLVMLSTLLLVALAVVALTDQGDDETTEDTADGARPARSFHRARSMCRLGRRRITSGRPGFPSRSRCRTGAPSAAR
ncbi:MAG: hypothetical protein OER95_18185 [Acidimicrobiia bacterium]|nr:hypothetical protein [Acidimicrobiia bacterium]